MATPGGFVAVAEREVPERCARARLHRHEPTGAQLVTVEDGAPTHVFAIAFPTVPADDTGVAHILEHAVLCGSRRFPVRKPFALLLRSSLQTYLNASTMPDITVYPVASRNASDFANLMDVYLDAVFFPKLTAETFRQEGWRLEGAKGGTAAFHGVVYNEMKGMGAVPGYTLEETLRHALFPGTAYARAYAGDPAAIPSLEHADLVAFHRRHYAPSASFAFLSGPAVSTGMERLGAVLASAAGQGAHLLPAVPGDAALAGPRRVAARYPGRHCAPRRDGRVALGWALDPCMPARDRIGWRVLARYLASSPAAPLRRTLLDSGLGAELVGCGFFGQTFRPSLQLGLAGVDPAAGEQVEAAILDTLAEVADGRHEADAAAAIDGEDFALREGPAGHAPPGVAWAMDALTELRHGRDPLAALAFSEAIQGLRRKQAGGGRPLAALAAALLETGHRATAIVEADPDLAAERARRERELAARLAQRHRRVRGAGAAAGMDFEPPEAIAAVPVLRLSDIPVDEPDEPVEIVGREPDVLLQGRATQGIVYLDVAVDLASLPAERLSEAALLVPGVLGTGTAQSDRDTLVRRIAADTGGIHAEAWAAPTRSGGAETRLVLRAKALAVRAEALFSLVGEILGAPVFDAPERLREVVQAEISRRDSALLPRAHEVVDRRLRAGLGEAGRREEALNGLTGLDGLRDLTRSADPAALAGGLEALAGTAMARPVLVSVTADPPEHDRLEWLARSLAQDLLRGAQCAPAATATVAGGPRIEALEAESAVNYLGLGGNLYAAGLAPTGATEAALRHVANVHLWEEIRERGGAYGVPVRFEPIDGSVSFLSYRDPHLARTVAAFRGASGFLRQPPSERDRRSSVIAAIGARDRPLPPGEAAARALRRHLTGEDHAWRAERRAALLDADPRDFVQLAEALEAMEARIVAIGGAAALGEMAAGTIRRRLT